MNWFQRKALAFNPEVVSFIEHARAELATYAEIKESITDLQLDMESAGWMLMTSRSREEFGRSGLDLITEMSRLMAIKNPLVGRGCRISSYFVFGRGVDIRSDHKATNKVIQEFWADPDNACELSQIALYESNIAGYTDGGIYFCLFPNKERGGVKVRTIDAMQIREIVTDPDDSAVPQYYKRVWTQSALDIPSGAISQVIKTAWYPSVNYNPPAKPVTIGSDPVMWESPVLHHKVGGLKKWRFGLSRVYPAIDWSLAYTKLLDDYCKKAENLARFGWKAKTKGGQKSVDAIKGALQTTIGAPGYSERNPPAQTGSAFISGEGVDLSALRVAGANSDPEEGRRVAHMVYNCFDLDERYFGDVDVGSLATGTSMDRPTELAFRSQQEAWEETFLTMLRYVVSVARGAAGSDEGKSLREAKIDPRKVQITASFPSLIQQDPEAAIGSIVKAFSMGASDGKCAGMLDPKTAAGIILNVLGVDDAQAAVDRMYPDGYKPEDFAATPPEPAPAPGEPDPAAPLPTAPQTRRSSRSRPAA